MNIDLMQKMHVVSEEQENEMRKWDAGETPEGNYTPNPPPRREPVSAARPLRDKKRKKRGKGGLRKQLVKAATRAVEAYIYRQAWDTKKQAQSAPSPASETRADLFYKVEQEKLSGSLADWNDNRNTQLARIAGNMLLNPKFAHRLDVHNA